METSESANLKQATAFVQAWTRRHNQAAVLMAIPLVAAFAITSLFPSSLSDVVMAVAPPIALTTGIILIPEDFRSRRGSLNSAVCLIAAMWAVALIVALFRFLA